MKNQMGKHYWKDALLFSLLGCFSFFFIAFYTDIPLRYQDNLLTLQTFIAVIISFIMTRRPGSRSREKLRRDMRTIRHGRADRPGEFMVLQCVIVKPVTRTS